MRCVKLENSKSLVVDEMEKPISHDGSVIIKVKSCGICGSDIHYWENCVMPGLVLGHEFAGEVVDPGNRDDLKIGDRVTGLPISPCMKCDACKCGNVQYCRETWENAVGLSLSNPGGYSEYVSCRPDMVKPIPENVTFNEAAMVEPSAVSYHAVSLADIKVGTKVLVVGGGIIGLMACEFAKLDGASYIGLLETNDKRAKKALTVGCADETFNAKDTDLNKKLLEKSNGGFDVVIECCGSGPAVSEALMAVRPGGTVVLVGVAGKPITIPTIIAVLGEVTIKGAIAYTDKEFTTCIELIDQNKIDVKKYIDDIVPLEKVQKSFERLTSGKDDAIKIIINPEI